jgi:glucosylglycerate synthase
LPDDTLLSDDLLRQLMAVGEVDLLVGIPSYNNAGTIAQCVETIEATFHQNFVRERVVIVNIDGGSKDGTPDLVMNAPAHRSVGGRGITYLRTMHRVATQYEGGPSQRHAMQTIMASADLLHAKACAIVSPATSNVSIEWLTNLLTPVYRKDFDFVAPLYCRQKFDGLLNRNLLYPMTRAIFGRQMRELYTGECGFSGRLAALCLDQDAWNEQAIPSSPEVWVAINAIAAGLRCSQAFLGPRIPAVAGPGPDLVEAIRQSVGSLFWCCESKEQFWMGIAGSESVPTFGPDHQLTDAPARINRKRIFELFQRGVLELAPVLQSILAPETLAEIQRVAALDEKQFRFRGELWARVLCEYAASYHHSVINRDHMIQALVPLYRGRMFSFLVEHQDSSPDEIEKDSEHFCLELERQKPYLIERWKAGGTEVKS